MFRGPPTGPHGGVARRQHKMTRLDFVARVVLSHMRVFPLAVHSNKPQALDVDRLCDTWVRLGIDQ